FVSALKGAGDTRFILNVSLLMATLLAGLSWLAVEVLQFGVYGCWTVLTVWIWGLGITYVCRFLQGKWKSMRVIEVRGTGHSPGSTSQNGQPSKTADPTVAQ
ncbi:MAG: hypothetical protein MKZ95_02865, partial [Pirellulales bacterium]|nr:hypothetical protein [Pirellulales bacterium]